MSGKTFCRNSFDQLQQKEVMNANPKLLTKMLESIIDNSPEYFEQFNKIFKFFTHPTLTDKLIHFPIYAYGFHKESTSDYCNSGNHYQKLVEADQK